MFGKFMFWCGTPPRCEISTADDDDVTFQPMMTAVQKNIHPSISPNNNNDNHNDDDRTTDQKSSIKTVGTPPDDDEEDDDDDDVIPPPVSPIGSGTDGSQTSFSSGSSRGSETYDDTLIGDVESTSGSTMKTSEQYDNGSKVITYKRIGCVSGGDDEYSMADDDDVGSKSTRFTYGNSTANTAAGGDDGTAHTNNNNNQGEVSVASSEATTTAGEIQSCVTDILIKNPSTDNKLMFMLDEVHELARIGQNVTLKSDNILPDGVSKDNIYVDVAIDDDALVYDDDDDDEDEDTEKSEQEETDNHLNHQVAAKTTRSQKKAKIINNKEMIISVVDVICDDLSSVYCAESIEDAELVLCIVIVSLSGSRRVTTKSKSSKSKKSKSKKAFAEIGLTWQLFEPDTLQVYGGGLITQREDLPSNNSDDSDSGNGDDDGKQCLIQKIAPRIASKVMSKLAGNTSNDELLVEV